MSLLSRLSHTSVDEIITPSELLYTMWTSIGYMAGYRQQDSHEFLIAFLDVLDDHSRENHTDGLPRITSPRISPRFRHLSEESTSPRSDGLALTEAPASWPINGSKSVNNSAANMKETPFSSPRVMNGGTSAEPANHQHHKNTHNTSAVHASAEKVDRSSSGTSATSGRSNPDFESSSRHNSVDSLFLAERPLMKVTTSVAARSNERNSKFATISLHSLIDSLTLFITNRIPRF